MGHEVFKPKSLKISTHEHTIDEQVSSLHLNLIDLSKYMQEREDSCFFSLTHPVVKYGQWALAVLEEDHGGEQQQQLQLHLKRLKQDLS